MAAATATDRIEASNFSTIIHRSFVPFLIGTPSRALIGLLTNQQQSIGIAMHKHIAKMYAT